MARRPTDDMVNLHHIHEHNINHLTNEIFLHSFIDADPAESGIDYRSSSTFIKNFNFLDTLNNRPIIVHLHTIGGSISDGLAIYDTIRQSKKHVYIVGYSEVQSMSSVILMAGDIRLLMPHTTFMVHNAILSISDSPTHGMKSYLRLLNIQEDFMLNVYAEKCVNGKFFKDRGYSLSKIRAYIKRRMTEQLDWYMGAEEALDLGFCDGIIGGKEYPTLDALRKL